jgi:hypothetical protein
MSAPMVGRKMRLTTCVLCNYCVALVCALQCERVHTGANSRARYCTVRSERGLRLLWSTATMTLNMLLAYKLASYACPHSGSRTMSASCGHAYVALESTRNTSESARKPLSALLHVPCQSVPYVVRTKHQPEALVMHGVHVVPRHLRCAWLQYLTHSHS